MIKIKPFCDFVINVSFDKKEYNRIIKSRIDDYDDMIAAIGVNGKATWLENKENGSPYFIIGIFADLVEVVAHEASHCTTHIMDFLGIKDDEFRAYMVGYITQEICLKLRELKDKDERIN